MRVFAIPLQHNWNPKNSKTMFKADQIKGILADYGGTIDTNGIHWVEVMWKSYQAIQIPVNKDDFRQAYIHGERTLATHPIIHPHHNFWHVLRLKAGVQLQWLWENKHLPSSDPILHYTSQIADWCYVYAQTTISAARPVLKNLAERYPIVLVTNFYGNIQTVLEDFHIREFFLSIVESSVVGIRKPDPGIFRIGVERLGFAPGEIAVIGDSYEKDIRPASTLGCHTLWLKKAGWHRPESQETADVVFSNFSELLTYFPRN
jgi:putative hydrolase of the HAD superfamily